VLNNLHGEHDVESLARRGERLGRRRAIVDGQAGGCGMQPGHLDVDGGGVGADHIGAEPRHRLRQEPAAAADVEQPQGGERLRFSRIAAEMARRNVANIGQPHRVELVQGPELSVRVPPFGGHPLEFLDFGRVQAAVDCAGRRGALHGWIDLASVSLGKDSEYGRRDQPAG
jgi:hypothetical protein